MNDIEYALQQRNPFNTTAEWAAINPILLNGEIAFENTGSGILFKIGDGYTHWSDLPYSKSSSSRFTEGGGITITDTSTYNATLTARLRYTVLSEV